jgi:hypothetical protein
LGRAAALERLRAGLGTVADQGALLDEADSDRERRSVLLALITSAWELRDRAADAYASLERAADDEGVARGVLE